MVGTGHGQVTSSRTLAESLLSCWKRWCKRVERTSIGVRGRYWPGSRGSIGHALEGELIGIEEKDGMHRVFFADVQLGFLDDERPELGLVRPPVTCKRRTCSATTRSCCFAQTHNPRNNGVTLPVSSRLAPACSCDPSPIVRAQALRSPAGTLLNKVLAQRNVLVV